MKYEVTCNTKYDGQIDLSVVSCESDGVEDVRTQVIRQVIHTGDKFVRDSLVNLGWIPPVLPRAPACVPPPVPNKKCIVKGCGNRSWEGCFIGDLCAPCHDMLTRGTVSNGTTFIHRLRDRAQAANLLQSAMKLISQENQP